MKVIYIPLEISKVIFALLYSIPLLNHVLDGILCWITALLRLGTGTFVAPGESKQPAKPLIFYEYEGCPFCKRVREHLNILDLDALIYPCPRSTLDKFGAISKESRFRQTLKELGGKAMFPFLIDENTNTKMYESDDIIKYLWKTYGQNKQMNVFSQLADFPLVRFPTLFMVSLLRPLPQQGIMVIPSHFDKDLKPLELWSFETSPYCKIVREVLASLQIPYYHRTCGKRSLKRKEFKEKYGDRLSSIRATLGWIQVPLLIDPNTKTEMFESKDIVKYLMDTYGGDDHRKNE